MRVRSLLFLLCLLAGNTASAQECPDMSGHERILEEGQKEVHSSGGGFSGELPVFRHNNIFALDYVPPGAASDANQVKLIPEAEIGSIPLKTAADLYRA